jgi:hypothetical protein
VNAGAFVRSTITLAIGYALAAALLWGLLNVPESNVPALLLSALLVLLIAIMTGVTTGTAAALSAHAGLFASLRRAIRALPVFLLGVVIFALLWWLTGVSETWWNVHRGEVDALFLRYLGFTRTSPLHTTIFWLLSLVRWVLGLSLVVAPVVVSVRRGSGLLPGLRVATRLLPLLAATIGLLIITQGLWRVAYWRPGSLPATQMEVVFAAAKLGLLYLAAMAVSAAVLGAYTRTADRA